MFTITLYNRSNEAIITAEYTDQQSRANDCLRLAQKHKAAVTWEFGPKPVR